MPKYRVVGEITVSAWTLVEADTPEDACRIASDREGHLCPHGVDQDGGDPFEYGIIGDGDGLMRCCLAAPAAVRDLRRWEQREEDERSDAE